MNIIEKMEKIENILNNVKTDFEIYQYMIWEAE